MMQHFKKGALIGMEAKALTKEELRKMQLLQLDMLVELDRVCRKHDIPYCIGWGTLLGAVRHAGYIPWDDDADVAMLREDYEKFKAVACDLNPEICWFQDHTTDAEYRWEYGKLRRTGTTYIRAGQEHLKCKTGVFIDIFPLDDVPTSPIPEKIHAAECFVMRKILWAEAGKYSATGFEKIIYQMLSKIPPSFAHNRMASLAAKSRNNTPNGVRILGLPLFTGYKMPKSWFLNRAEYSFEGKKLFGIKDADEFLRFRYGDYMSLPPENEREQHAPVSSFSF